MKSYWRASKHSPAIAIDRNGTPILIGKVEVEPAGMLSDTHIDRPLGSIKLRSASSRSSADPIAPAPAAVPVAW
jgi:hypothetical protein